MRKKGRKNAGKPKTEATGKMSFGASFNHVELGNPNIPIVMNGKQDDVGHTNTFWAGGQRPFFPIKGNRIFLYQNVLLRNEEFNRHEQILTEMTL